MLTRSWKNNGQPMDGSAQAPQLLPSTNPPRMGEFRYDGRRKSREQSSIPPDTTSTSHRQAAQRYLHMEQHRLPIPNRFSNFPQSKVPYPQVSKTPGFHPSTQPRELFPSKVLPPIGTGRPSSYDERDHSVPASNIVSVTSRSLKSPGTYINPFAEALEPYLKKPGHKKRRISVEMNTHLDMPSQRCSSALEQRPHAPPFQTLARELAQHGVPIRSGSPTRRPSVSFRRRSQAEPQDRRNKLGDNSSPSGIVKTRRDSSPRKAAAAVRAAMIHSARKEVKSEPDEVSPKTSKRSWAQVASRQIKEEPIKDNIALQDVRQQASVSIKQEKVEESNIHTWAQIAAAKWMESKSKEQQLRNEGFGKPYFKIGQMSLKAKDDDVNAEVNEVPTGVIYHGLDAIRARQKTLEIEKGSGKNGRICSRGRHIWGFGN
jgi:hypothetical protein